MKDRPTGITQEAKTKFPIIFSSSLEEADRFFRSSLKRREYFTIFFSGKKQSFFRVEHYT